MSKVTVAINLVFVLDFNCNKWWPIDFPNLEWKFFFLLTGNFVAMPDFYNQLALKRVYQFLLTLIQCISKSDTASTLWNFTRETTILQPIVSRHTHGFIYILKFH